MLLFQHGIALPLLPGPGVRADSSIQSRGELAQAGGNTQLGRKKPSDDGGANHVLMADLGGGGASIGFFAYSTVSTLCSNETANF